MNIGALAQATGITASRIRFYEERGLIAPAMRRANGYRDYAPGTIAAINLILRAQRLGFTLADIQRHGSWSKGLAPCSDETLAQLQARLRDVDLLIAQSIARRAEIAGLIDDIRRSRGLAPQPDADVGGAGEDARERVSTQAR